VKPVLTWRREVNPGSPVILVILAVTLVTLMPVSDEI